MTVRPSIQRVVSCHLLSPARQAGTCLLLFAALVLGALSAPGVRAATAAPAGVNAAPPASAAAPASVPVPVQVGAWVHALSSYQPPKYPRGFAHFDYVNPAAPKGGVLRLGNPDRRSSFDKLNPFTVKGVAPAAVSLFMFESLTYSSQDEPQAMYGLLAEEMFVAPDLSSISFRLHPKARFANGDPVLADDVVYCFQMLTSAQATPAIRAAYAPIEKVVKVDDRTVRFDLRERKVEPLFTAGGLPVFSRKWGQVGGASKKFDEIVGEPPITTGPYLIEKAEMPRRIDLRRNPDYWARDLGVRRGFFNFDRITYRMYKDQAIRREAFKAGEFDIMKEYSARAWARQHAGVKWRDGRIQKTSFETATGQGMQGIDFNLRRPKFQDIRVREAITLAWDFETINRYKSFKRANSLFNNSDFAAVGLPSAEELALLEPFRAELPARVFGPAFVAPRTDTGPNALRANLLRARDLLAEAGWKVAADGKLRNAQGEAFEFEYLEPNQIGRNIEWQRNLEKLGITLTERLVDFALYRRRLETFDFDTITIVEGDFTLPSASDLENLYGSKSADEPGSNNFRGVKSRAVDHLIGVMSRASTLAELRTAARAFDRIVMWNFWQMPELYFNREPASYWNKFGMPKVQASYFSIDTAQGGGPWPLWTWWDKSLDQAATAQPRP
ncbi:MAG: ABC transporter substrate-binding protein [Burkholderiales bacterium]|nr:ABC transporter substrate-binding protein [Burkholderiales bacterium]